MKKVLLSALVLSIALVGCNEKQQAEVDANSNTKEKLDKFLDNQNRKTDQEEAERKAFTDSWEKSLKSEPASSDFKYKGPTAAEIADKNRKENKDETPNKQ